MIQRSSFLSRTDDSGERCRGRFSAMRLGRRFWITKGGGFLGSGGGAADLPPGRFALGLDEDDGAVGVEVGSRSKFAFFGS
jgi:hypothetical protein